MSTLSVQNITGVANLALANGSVTMPALSSSYGQTGIYFPAANTIGFVEGGTEAARVDLSGNLLIGRTTSTVGSGVKLDVAGAINTSSLLIAAGASGNILIGRTDSTVGAGVKLDVAGAVNASAVLVNGAEAATTGKAIAMVIVFG